MMDKTYIYVKKNIYQLEVNTTKLMVKCLESGQREMANVLLEIKAMIAGLNDIQFCTPMDDRQDQQPKQEDGTQQK